MQTIAFITDRHVGAHIAAVEGIYERARTYGWHVVEIEYEYSQRPISDYLATWKPAGCIFSCSALTAPLAPELFRKLPTIYIDPDEETLRGRHHCVINDPIPTAKLAFRELSALNCASYGYVGWNEPTPWSDGRRQVFETLVRADGKPYSAYTDNWTGADRLHFNRRLANWLGKLPKPCGVFAANDDTASQVADACHFSGLEIPQQVAILGVDNLEIICENAITSLSSIEIDFCQLGRVCADFLADLLTNPKLPPENRLFGPSRVVRRQSTRNLTHADPRITRVLERIRREACLGLTAANVIADIGLCRRAAEQRFRKMTGSSILEEINRIRLDHVFTLLKKPDFPISLIAQQCGWQTDVFLKKLFKRTTGMTMREWRKQAARSCQTSAS